MSLLSSLFSRADRADAACAPPPPAPDSVRIDAPLRERLAAWRAFPADVCGAQLVWGPGRVTPGDGNDDAALLDALGVFPGARLAWIGAGLGGPALTVAQTACVDVTGYEWRKIWRDHARAMIGDRAAAGRVALKAMDQEGDGLSHGPFDAAVCVDRFHELAEPDAVLARIRAALAPDAGAVFVEPVREATAALSDDDPAAKLPTHHAWVDRLRRADFVVDDDMEVSGAYAARIRKRWAGLRRDVEGLLGVAVREPGVRPALVVMQRLVARAAMRIEALESGRVAVYRFRAIKRAAHS